MSARDEDKGPAPPATPVMFDHCVKVYEKMLETATPQNYEEETLMVYEGFLTRLIADLGMSTPYFSAIRAGLVRMGCMVQIRRGGGGTPSQWLLRHAPSKEQFSNAADMSRTRQKQSRLDVVEANQRLISQRLSKLETALGMEP